jgi:SMC interacting uncharacterized protein involved in chromosome segregation
MQKLKRIAIYTAIALLVFFIGSGIGSAGAEITLNEKKVDAIALDEEISRLKKEIARLETELNDLKTKNKEAFDIVANKDKAKAEFDQLQKDLASAKSELENLNAQISEKQKELSKLTGQVQVAKTAPKKLQAGYYTVGKDIPAGRYQAVPVGQGSNFVVRDEAGSLVVNTILGEIGVPSYTFECMDGYMIQTEAPVKLIPLQ